MKATSIFIVAAALLCACHDNDKPATSPTPTTYSSPGPSPSQPMDSNATGATNATGADATRPIDTTIGGSATSGPTTGSAGTSDTGPSDRKLADDVRTALNDLKGLSAGAKKIDVDVSSGKVTLRGDVRNEAEHRKVLNTAKKAAIGGWIEDQISVKK